MTSQLSRYAKGTAEVGSLRGLYQCDVRSMHKPYEKSVCASDCRGTVISHRQ